MSPRLPLLAGLLLTAVLGFGCGSDPAPQVSGEGGASSNEDRVLVATLAPVPTRTPEPPTPTQAAVATLSVPTPLPATPTRTATQRPADTATPHSSAAQTPTTFAVGFSASPTPTATGTTSPTATPLSPREQAIFDAHNDERSSRGITPLSIDPTLQTIARARAEVMAENNLFSHYAPNGDTIFDLFADVGYEWNDATENIHFNDYGASQADAVAMQEFMASPAHRANILKPGFHRVGAGVATSSSGVHYYSVVLSD